MALQTISVDTHIFNEIFSNLEPKDIWSFLLAMHLNEPSYPDITNNDHYFSKKELFNLFYSDKHNIFISNVKTYILSIIDNELGVLEKLFQHNANMIDCVDFSTFNVCRNFFPLLDELEIKVLNASKEQFCILLFKIIKFVVSMELFNTPITLESFVEISDLCESYGMIRPESGRKTVITVLAAFERFRNGSRPVFKNLVNAKTLEMREKIFKKIYSACLRQLQLFEKYNSNSDHLDTIDTISLSSEFEMRYPILKNCLFGYFYANNYFSETRLFNIFDSLLTTPNGTIFAIESLHFIINNNIIKKILPILSLLGKYNIKNIYPHDLDPSIKISLFQSFSTIILYSDTHSLTLPLSIMNTIIEIANCAPKTDEYRSIIGNIFSVFPFNEDLNLSDTSSMMIVYYINFYQYITENADFYKHRIHGKFFEFYFNFICSLFISYSYYKWITIENYDILVDTCVSMINYAKSIENENRLLSLINAMSNTPFIISREIFEHLVNLQKPLLKFNLYTKFAKFLRLRNIDYVSILEYKVIDLGEIDESIISYFIDNESQFLPLLALTLIEDDCHYSLGIMLRSLFKLCNNDRTVNSIIDKIIEVLISSRSINCIIVEYPFIKNRLFRRFSCRTLEQLSEKMKYCEKYSFFATIISPNILASLSSNLLELFNIKHIEKIINYLALGSTTPSSHDKMLIKHFFNKNKKDITNLKIKAVQQKRNDILTTLIDLENE